MCEKCGEKDDMRTVAWKSVEKGMLCRQLCGKAWKIVQNAFLLTLFSCWRGRFLWVGKMEEDKVKNAMGQIYFARTIKTPQIR